ACIESYLETADPNRKPFLLVGFISTNKLLANSEKNMETVLPKLAELIGAAGVKAGQAAFSYPNTRESLRKTLARLMSQSRILYRWELLRRISIILSQDLFEQIESIDETLGGASFYLAVKVVLKNKQIAVLRLMREDVQQEADYGFCHLQKS